ncbi:MAG: type II toxin-antitoxin system VapC family toxin [Prevotellaceae bacterium]|jgi:predicted nucleic acid-binding protein|nr:type II toxin-antitoxin system VapC family toxin [Prevotellaceae bacterium]
MSSKIKRIYVDTNVLINYCTGQDRDVKALAYVFSKRRKEVLFTSSLAVVQTITKLQSGSKQHSRKAYSRETTIKKLNEILPKFTVLSLSLSDIKAGFNHLNSDVEDSVHYVLSQKMKCDAILTNNTKDFAYFKNVALLDANLAFLKPKVQ